MGTCAFSAAEVEAVRIVSGVQAERTALRDLPPTRPGC